MSQISLYQERGIVTYDQGKAKPAHDLIVDEIPLTVYVNDTELATLICSSGAFKELAIGFLINEGIVKKYSDIKDITFNETDGLMWVETTAPVKQTETFLKRQIASCCGKGRACLYFVNDVTQMEPVKSSKRFAAPHLLRLIGMLEEGSVTHSKTHGVHSAAMGDDNGLLAMFDDIGRHNAVDKVLGHALLNNLMPDDKCLLLSGRVSSEILIKAGHSGIPLVVSRAAPTSLAVDLAGEFGIALVGFARGERMNIYSHPEKVVM
ncbi:formate dehydrogenase accessory sulfurtransferase FdhD [Pelotomaculum terephthalicicum JT]|uniref:formate dehydrogenase accessory sulfurtransferase FdhD n=1 Tax=Pelotomaculum TaxID=191373 RepID=UPI0009C4DE33|nr:MULTISPECIES: formate dehydrogenase accessory sulfurtransferase FdhD [Pelotomaculum]MCG9966812.1 formate dehydrogenase accessory sulfurtransferase FdhD [Pelotomaculum terephthalicicum JT]OPX91593.1 MAG: formate dehydrogenase accessory protein [Pelotomaculum sp. PtaB.Bin117]OPY62308.1 MAG: formate dehydrogenase accessory protein [Pelotomaculum sp. PtaU1.Bin065]